MPNRCRLSRETSAGHCMIGACEERAVLGETSEGSWSHRLLRAKVADADQMAGGAARADPRLGGFWRLGRAIGGVFSLPSLMWWGRALEQEQLTGSGREIALGGVPQAEVADLVQPLRQNMLQEPAHELFARDPAGAPAVGLAFLVAEGDAAGIEVDDAAVGDGDAEDVAGKVIEHRLLALA